MASGDVISALLGVIPGDPFRSPLGPGYEATPGGDQGTATSPPVQPPFPVPSGTDPGSVKPPAMGFDPRYVWGGADNEQSHTAPKWLQDLVAAYKSNPTDAQWRHIVLNEGVKAPYANLQMPDWLKSWLLQAMGPEPTSRGTNG